MKRILAAVLAIVCLFASSALAESFSTDPAAINQAALSVLKLEIYDRDLDLIATGSGFVAFDNQHLITNFHVIEGSRKIIAYSDDGAEYVITHVDIVDEDKDIAIVEFDEPTDLIPLKLNESGEVIRATPVVAIGSPKGFSNTVSTGIVSSAFRRDGAKRIQFTAPISSGSSGGALFNDEGVVIGITTSSYDDGSGIIQNLNFAVNIIEAIELYQRWDGKKYELLDAHKAGVRVTNPKIGTERPSDKTSIPSEGSIKEPPVTPEPTEEPTEKPTEVPTETPTPEPADEPTEEPTPEPTEVPIPKTAETGRPVSRLRKNGDTFDVRCGVKANLRDCIATIPLDADETTFEWEIEAVDVAGSYEIPAVTGNYATFTREGLYRVTVQATGQPETRFSFDLNVLPENGNTLFIPDDAQIQWYTRPNDVLEVHIQVENMPYGNTAAAFELSIYATDAWGRRIYEEPYYWTTEVSVPAGIRSYSEYVKIPDRREIDKVYIAIHKVKLWNGEYVTFEGDDLVYHEWTVD